MKTLATCRGTVIKSDDPAAKETVASALAEVLSDNWLEGADLANPLAIEVESVKYFAFANGLH